MIYVDVHDYCMMNTWMTYCYIHTYIHSYSGFIVGVTIVWGSLGLSQFIWDKPEQSSPEYMRKQKVVLLSSL